MKSKAPGLELWGGVECTLNRVGDRYHDQLERSGHRTRLDDLDRFAALGLRTLRFPILWEAVAANADNFDWRWSDAAMQRCRELGIRPIVGLLHHGSGPRYTDLLDPDFPRKFAAYARAVAERYPWIDAYTPINEPLTTARFSALYGLWFPHRRDKESFVRALWNQSRATVLAMQEIRVVNPAAMLIQTDDLGCTIGSPGLQYQVDFENERRWLGWDLLIGKVDRDHPMWGYLRWSGLTEEEILDFRDEPCPPDLIGINYYITSERFLDADWRRYPGEDHAGNGRDQYVDVSAVGVRAEGIFGPARIYEEAWSRYKIPLAITEAHLGCTADEQMRWFHEIWVAVNGLRRAGADIRAVTAWAILGAYDWESLVTRDDGRYESGAFDVSSGEIQPTALAEMIGALACGKLFANPLLDIPGWWRRPARLLASAAVGCEVEPLYRAAS